MWGPRAKALARTHTVIVPDLPCLGRSSISTGGYDMKTVAKDLRADRFAGRPGSVPEEERLAFAAAYAEPGRMRAGFSYFQAFAQNAEDNEAFAVRKPGMPVLAVGGELSFGDNQAKLAREVADDVTGHVAAGSGHWLIEEAPTETIGVVQRFLDGGSCGARCL